MRPPFQRYLVFALSVIALFSQTKGKLPPIDETTMDTSFVAFQRQLVKAITERDAVSLMAMVSPQIRSSFGEGGGKKEFGIYWKLDKPKESELWAKLGEAVKLGCARMPNSPEYAAPYVYARFPDEYDSFDHLAVVLADAKLYAQPRIGSTIVESLQWDILKRGDEKTKAPAGWVKVQTLKGRIGWVQTSAVRSPIDYRAIFEKRSGKWWMTAFVSGD